MLTRVWNKVLGFTKQYMKLPANRRFTFNRKKKKVCAVKYGIHSKDFPVK